MPNIPYAQNPVTQPQWSDEQVRDRLFDMPAGGSRHSGEISAAIQRLTRIVGCTIERSQSLEQLLSPILNDHIPEQPGDPNQKRPHGGSSMAGILHALADKLEEVEHRLQSMIDRSAI